MDENRKEMFSVMFVQVNIHIFKSSLKKGKGTPVFLFLFFQFSVTKSSFYVRLKQKSFFFFLKCVRCFAYR